MLQHSFTQSVVAIKQSLHGMRVFTVYNAIEPYNLN